MPVRRLVLILSDCADEERNPPPSQITELIKQWWDQTPKFRSISLVKVSGVACWLYFLVPTCFLHSTVSTTLKMCPLSFVSCSQYSASRKGPPTQITASGYHSVECRETPALGLTHRPFEAQHKAHISPPCYMVHENS